MKTLLFYVMRVVAAIMIVAILPLLCGCLWIFAEKETCATDIIVNKTNNHILIMSHKSVGDYNDPNPSMHVDTCYIDTIQIKPNEQHVHKQCDRGYAEIPKKFERLLYDGFVTDSSGIVIFPSIDSVEIIFDNMRRILIKNYGCHDFCFKELNDFWAIEGRSDEFCNRKKGLCRCTYAYFITNEMYEQAEPIRR